MASVDDYSTYYQERDKRHRNHPSVETAKGWHAYHRVSGKAIHSPLIPFQTEEAAQAAIAVHVERLNAAPPTEAAPKAETGKQPRIVGRRYSDHFGDGVVYEGLEGATHYRGLDGRHTVQIWDEA